MKKSTLLLCALILFNPLAAQADDAWRVPDKSNILLMNLESGQVIIELAPQFAPEHVANIKQLVTQKYFDKSMILRSQDNYVVQWGDPNSENDQAKSLGKARLKLSPEFYRNNKDINYTSIVSRDAYADEVGFVDGFTVASDANRAWLTHCYGMVGVSRGMAEDSGNGSGLYIVTGHAPRHLDLNVTLVGRVLKGMELLSSLPRGTGPLGFYETAPEYVPINTMAIAQEGDVNFKIMHTNSNEFEQHVLRRTNRNEDWFLEPSGKIELCNVGVPVKFPGNK